MTANLPRDSRRLARRERNRVGFFTHPWSIRDRFSLQGVPLLLDDLTGTGVILAPKLQLFRSRHLQAAVGTLQALGSGGTGGVGYAVATLGSARTAATVGYGYGYGQVADSAGSPGVLLLGAEQALGRSVRLIVEAYIGGEAPLLTIAKAF